MEDFPIEFFNDTDQDDDLQMEAEERLRKLAEKHNDIVGATVYLKQEAQGKDHAYEVTVRVYIRGDDVVVTEQGPQLPGVFKAAMNLLERQVRTHREKLRNY